MDAKAHGKIFEKILQKKKIFFLIKIPQKYGKKKCDDGNSAK